MREGYGELPHSTGDTTLTNSVVVNAPLYIAGNLCLQNSSAIMKGPLIVRAR